MTEVILCPQCGSKTTARNGVWSCCLCDAFGTRVEPAQATSDLSALHDDHLIATSETS